MNIEKKGCISVEEMATYIGCGRSTAYELVRRSNFPKIRLGRKIIIPIEALDAWLKVQAGGEK